MTNLKNFTLLTLFFFCCPMLWGQKNLVSLSIDYGVYESNAILANSTLDTKGFTASLERSLTQRLAIGGAFQWQFFEPYDLLVTDASGNLLNASLLQNVIMFQPIVKWYLLHEGKSKLYVGPTGNINYLTVKTDGVPNTLSFYDPSDYTGLGAGVLLGYRYQFSSGWGVFAQGNADWLWFDIGSNGDAKPFFHASLGVAKAF